MAERTLVVVRHGKSDWSAGESDRDRPLAARGRRQASRTGTWLEQHVAPVDLAIVSPAARARATWDLVATRLHEAPEVDVVEDTYPGSAAELLGVLRSVPDEVTTLALVGHNPGLSDLVTELTGEEVPLVTSAVAVVRVAGPWSAAGRSGSLLVAVGRPPRVATSDG